MTSYRKNLMLVLLLVASTAIVQLEAKTVFRRTDKISENFKQLDLPPEEIDPNVAPPESEPPKVDDVVDAAVPVIDESANEITSADVESTNAVQEVATAAAAPAPAPAAAAAAVETPVAEAAPEAAAAAVTKPPKVPSTTAKPQNPISRYCKCSESQCDCCRKFGLPLLTSQGCARIAYLGNDEMNVSLKYGDITLASRRISSKRARPICVGLPGGYSEFCGRVYGLSRSKESKDFKACLAFELRSDEEVEASLRVSCFKFGPEGLRVAEAEPLPTKPASDDDDDDDDDIFGFAAGGDDDEDEDDDYDSETDNDADADTDDDDDTEDYADDDEAEAPEDADYGGFSLAGLLDELDDDEDEKPAKKPAAAAAAAAAAAGAGDQTREHVSTDGQAETQLVQSKDEAGAPAATVPAKDDAAASASAAAADEAALPAAVEGEVTPAPAAADLDSTTPKAKKSKKAKKNKKKKAAAEATEETGFAYELLNGILDFFN
ncbi:uncharacterized protein LOC110184613 [Drosophila serrata]|uniref:uncharacterized protein LOC110184613 n=2 Tax=Drosophila serrata TaxID=7274 RepID=UPI000A1D0C88|nr:uncharacterized protein LOC110184613 [Drosophila serrata]XP_020808865.1 uncharacterized protein LOC110184613 [Drosophila serrata]